MPHHPFGPLEGRIEHFSIHSAALRGNLLGDPTQREISVYLPPGLPPSGGWPMMVDLVGFGGSGRAHLNWKPFHESVPQRHERLVREGEMGPCVLVFPDCFTSLGGNQYIDSVAMGRWASFLTLEMLPALEERYPIRPGRTGRAVFGKSSGGYGAIIHGLRHAEHWGAIACHSGDMGFDRLFLGEFPRTLNMLTRCGGITGFLEEITAAPKLSDDQFHTIMVLAMGATYDPDPAAPYGIRLPVDLHTCELFPERWRCWLAHDPVVVIAQPEAQDKLRMLGGLYFDCGSRDQYHIHFGARQLVRILDEVGIAHTYHEFDDTHSNIDYRMDCSLPFLYQALMGASD